MRGTAGTVTDEATPGRPSESRGDAPDTSPRRPDHLAAKVAGFVVLVAAIAALAATLARFDGGSVAAPPGDVECSDAGSAATTSALAHTSDTCRATNIVKFFVEHGQVGEARTAVIWHLVLAALATGALIWAARLEFRSVRLRLAARAAIAM